MLDRLPTTLFDDTVDGTGGSTGGPPSTDLRRIAGDHSGTSDSMLLGADRSLGDVNLDASHCDALEDETMDRSDSAAVPKELADAAELRDNGGAAEFRDNGATALREAAAAATLPSPGRNFAVNANG
jgi:hypothetical protein